ncbi:MAG TPA: FGGY family carbohydrate kinase [Myxococcota bacterium]|nr:FGGY family carbohydrate kinase [Myxococcota bacterium]
MAPSNDLPLVLAIDLGSSGVRVALVDVAGRALGSASEALAMDLRPDGAAEEDPEEIWRALGRSIERALARAPHARDRVAAIVCGSQYSSLVPVDARGHPVGPLVLYLDTRAAELSRELTRRRPELWKLWLERHGMPSSGSGSDSLAHWLWFQTVRPEIHAKARAYVEPMDYVTARLCGRVTANVCTLFPLLLTDNRRGSAGGWCEEMIEASGVDRAKLPELVAPGTIVGELLPEHASAWGLPRGVSVFSAMNDTQALTFGTASHVGDRLGVSIGTTLVPTTLLDEMRADLRHFLLTQPAPIDEKHVLMAEGGLAGKALEFVLQGLFYTGDVLGDHRREDAFAALDAAAGATEPGAGGVLFLPWLSGAWAPAADPQARGGFLNLHLSTTRADLVRAALEGVAYQLRWLLPHVEALTGRRHDELVFGAGGARSDAWAQILADVCDRPVRQLAEPTLTNCRGAALLAFHRLGLLDLHAADALLVERRRYEPRPELRSLYDDLGGRFVLAHERLGPVFGGPRSGGRDG